MESLEVVTAGNLSEVRAQMAACGTVSSSTLRGEAYEYVEEEEEEDRQEELIYSSEGHQEEEDEEENEEDDEE